MFAFFASDYCFTERNQQQMYSMDRSHNLDIEVPRSEETAARARAQPAFVAYLRAAARGPWPLMYLAPLPSGTTLPLRRMSTYCSFL